MFYDAVKNSHGLPLDPFKALVAPRPIAWVSTLAANGLANLAPYSFFNAFAEEPHYIAIGSGGYKHTLTNITATGEFVVNLVSEELREAMNATSASVPDHVDEFELAGLAIAASEKVRPPRVAKAPAAFECRHFKTIDLPADDGRVADYLVIGRVVGIHIDDRFIENGRVKTVDMRLIARLGYSEYATVETAWRIRRPG